MAANNFGQISGPF